MMFVAEQRGTDKGGGGGGGSPSYYVDCRVHRHAESRTRCFVGNVFVSVALRGRLMQ